MTTNDNPTTTSVSSFEETCSLAIQACVRVIDESDLLSPSINEKATRTSALLHEAERLRRGGDLPGAQARAEEALALWGSSPAQTPKPAAKPTPISTPISTSSLSDLDERVRALEGWRRKQVDPQLEVLSKAIGFAFEEDEGGAFIGTPTSAGTFARVWTEQLRFDAGKFLMIFLACLLAGGIVGFWIFEALIAGICFGGIVGVGFGLGFSLESGPSRRTSSDEEAA